MFLQDHGCLLRKADSGENHVLLIFFLRQNGLQMVLARKPTKSGIATNLPDLFESGELTLEKKGDKPAFLKEFSPGTHYKGIARDYSALKTASRLARFYELNLLHLEHFEAAWDLLHTALQSLSEKRQSATVLLKALYVFARSEGYPVKEQWLEKLPREERILVEGLIRQPVDSQHMDTSITTEWIRRLEIFLLQETDLRIPE